MLTRRLELGVDAPQLIVHPIDVGAQSAELVSIVDFHVAREVARRDGRQPVVDPLDRPDQRPRKDEPEEEGEHEGASRDTDEQSPRTREGAVVPSDQLLDLGLRPIRQNRGQCLEVARDALHPHAHLQSVFGSGVLVLVEGDELFVQDRPETVGGVPDLREIVSILKGRREAQLIRCRPRLDEASHGPRVSIDRFRVLPSLDLRPNLEEIPRHVLRQELAKIQDLLPELSVGGRPLLDLPEAHDAIVRLPEDELSEQSHRNEEHRRADERDQELRANRDRQTGDGADERIVDASQPSSLVVDGRSPARPLVRRPRVRTTRARSCRRRSS